MATGSMKSARETERETERDREREGGRKAIWDREPEWREKEDTEGNRVEAPFGFLFRVSKVMDIDTNLRQNTPALQNRLDVLRAKH